MLLEGRIPMCTLLGRRRRQRAGPPDALADVHRVRKAGKGQHDTWPGPGGWRPAGDADPAARSGKGLRAEPSALSSPPLGPSGGDDDAAGALPPSAAPPARPGQPRGPHHGLRGERSSVVRSGTPATNHRYCTVGGRGVALRGRRAPRALPPRHATGRREARPGASPSSARGWQPSEATRPTHGARLPALPPSTRRRLPIIPAGCSPRLGADVLPHPGRPPCPRRVLVEAPATFLPQQHCSSPRVLALVLLAHPGRDHPPERRAEQRCCLSLAQSLVSAAVHSACPPPGSCSPNPSPLVGCRFRFGVQGRRSHDVCTLARETGGAGCHSSDRHSGHLVRAQGRANPQRPRLGSWMPWSLSPLVVLTVVL
eukprot:scaffold3_cov389-Prasinococcus_capsulatus_cf.AAC.12